MKQLFFFFICCVSFQALAQRNVVLLIADDIGTDYFGFYEDHQDTVGVPHIRALMQKGVRFKNAMANPVCSATRGTMLSGRYGFRTGVGAVVGGTGGSGTLDTSEITIPRLLKIYNPLIGKANIGKWHLHGVMPSANLMNPLVLGYDHFEGPFTGALTSFTNWTKYTNGVQSTVTNYATSETVDNAVSWIKTQSGKPFFLWTAFNAPHSPFHLPPAGLHTYSTLPGTTAHINANPKLYFKAMMQALDTEIGRLMDSLQAMNRLDSTDFIFMGDNGNATQTAQIANVSRSKGTVYQYGVHVPFIISGPSVVNPGRSSDALVNVADVFATVLELFGYSNWPSQIPVAKPVDSKSLMPLIKNTATQVRPWAFCEVFKTTTDSNDAKAIRNMEYKLIRFNNGKEEFYKLSIDSLELDNLLNGSSMNSTDISNYYYLCGELTSLIGAGSFCNNLVAVHDVQDVADWKVYPNPFKDKLVVPSTMLDERFQLSELSGRIIYDGTQLESQDFSHLPGGIYLLKRMATPSNVIKLVK